MPQISNSASIKAMQGNNSSDSASSKWDGEPIEFIENFFGPPDLGPDDGDNTIDNAAYDSEDEMSYSHVSDEELTTNAEMTDLRTARTGLWEHDIDTGRARQPTKPTKPLMPPPSVVETMKKHTTAASIKSSISLPAAAKKMARRAIDSTETTRRAIATTATTVGKSQILNLIDDSARRAIATTASTVGKTEILHRFINGSARAPGQVLDWMTTNLANATNNKENISPAGRSISMGSLYTLPTPRSSATPSLVSTPATSGRSSPNASVTGFDAEYNNDEYDAMSAGTMFEMGPFGHIVPIMGEADDGAFEMVHNTKDMEVKDKEEQGFCVLAPLPTNY